MSVREGGLGLTKSHRAALHYLASVLAEIEAPWVITGSTAFALRGMPVAPADLDVQTDAAGAYAIQRVLAPYMVWPVRYRTAPTIRSHIGRAVIEGVSVEIMGAIQKRLPDGSWQSPVDLSPLIEWIDWEGRTWPVLPLSYESTAYRMLGRHSTADHLERWMAQSIRVPKEGVAMNRDRETFLRHLKQFGEENDRTAASRAEKMLNITEDTGLMIGMLIRAWKPARILEIGTSNGYSTIWWADALTDAGQRLVTLELNPHKVVQAMENFQRAGVADRIEIVSGDAAAFLQAADADAWNLIFLDAERSHYVGYWSDLIRILAPDGLLIVDNALDKAAELAEFRRLVANTEEFRHVLVPIGNGELFIQRDHPLH